MYCAKFWHSFIHKFTIFELYKKKKKKNRSDLLTWFLTPPNQVLPVMIMGAFIPGLRRKYPVREYISAMLLVIGLILFTLADAQTSPNFHIFGVVMISGALVMDAFLGNLQEAIFTMNPDTTQVYNLVLDVILFVYVERNSQVDFSL